ncbi:tetratricopeptide repeat protein [Paraburkholderia aspalathi]|uniref:tetratricopeptide repeat protein n=1 Tax=Paraburkholderia aspalathi TaxID=1324617 RepID=UPI0038B77E93
MRSRLLAGCVITLLTACAQNPPQSTTVRICDDQGCSERPKDRVNFDAADNGQGEEGNSSIAALKALAETRPQAAYDLGLRYFRGDGVRQDSYQALTWMQKAAERGNLQAQKALGSFYLFGLEEMGPDPREAEEWLLIASGRGDKESKALLAEARAAKTSDEAYYQWVNQQRPVFYDYWFSGYPYQGRWNSGTWYWR